MNKKIVNFLGKSSKGRRPQNEDNFTIFINKHGFLISVIADGMGGHIGGRMASSLTVKAIRDYYDNINFDELPNERSIQDVLIQSVKYIWKELKDASVQEPDLQDMGTTLNLNVFYNDEIYTLNIGDSRTTHYSTNYIQQISEDHNLASLAKKDPNLKNYEKFSNYLTSCLGPNKEAKLDIYRTKLRTSGIIIMTSDGIHGVLTEDDVFLIMKLDIPLRDKVNDMIQESFDKGSTDNMTVILVEYGN